MPLDGITMLEISGRTALAEKLREVQGQLLGFISSGAGDVPARHMDIPLLKEAAEEYRSWIQRRSAGL